MKKYVLLLAAILIYKGVFAQKQLTQYLFPEFKEGSVLQKSGTVTKTQLNYNTLTQEMIFKQGEQFLALDKIQEVDTVYLNDKKFIPGDNMFYEVATQTPVALLLQHTSDIIPSGNETGFGKSQTTAVTNIADLKRGGRAYSLSLPDEYSFKNKTAYFLKKDGKYILITNVKDIKKVFSDKESAIEDYTKKNKVNFKKNETVAALIEFCNSN
ncbi:hypothetical protein [Parafilimonas terrae]|uniref:Uncharacterized protein n=1 Tax=Parafilimonas terrae TaxID=1465490 RepID=A0A1I5WVE3_9BACT|nr:hypothetical protein [Parafilimonas terrae]SFQ23487.1 hypothetical protein SAMN05444277_10717 [Parafilimonas terrae]